MKKAYCFITPKEKEIIVDANFLDSAKRKVEKKLGKKLPSGTKYSSQFFLTSPKDVQTTVLKYRIKLFNKTQIKMGYDKQFTKDVIDAMKSDAIEPKTGQLKEEFQYDYDLHNFKESIPEGWGEFYEKKTGKKAPSHWDTGGSFTDFPFDSKKPKKLK
jgi:hypothetical protein